MHRTLRAALVAGVIALGSAGALLASDGEFGDGQNFVEGGGDGDDIIITQCTQGNLEVCGERTTRKCLDWKYMPTVGGSLTGASVGFTATCAYWEEVTINLYKNRRANG